MAPCAATAFPLSNAEDLVKEFGKNSFDVVISTEMLEHVVSGSR
jgi:2-polyprenyl-3-methyl-5-hydroxy-6-metoxy-1,4-benzoquinol methylase